MHIRKVIAAAVLFVSGLFTAAEAVPVTYTLDGVVSGSVGATNFNNASFTWTLTGDSNDRIWLPPPTDAWELPLTSQSFQITGIGAITPTLPMASFTDLPPNRVVLADTTLSGILFGAPELSNYDGISSVSPVFVYLLSSVPLATDRGMLLITNGEMMFAVNGVPEPITLALFGAGLAGIGALRRRKA